MPPLPSSNMQDVNWNCRLWKCPHTYYFETNFMRHPFQNLTFLEYTLKFYLTIWIFGQPNPESNPTLKPTSNTTLNQGKGNMVTGVIHHRPTTQKFQANFRQHRALKLQANAIQFNKMQYMQFYSFIILSVIIYCGANSVAWWSTYYVSQSVSRED